MAEELKELIDKINEEGVRAAEDKARAIEEEAKRRSGAIIKKAEEKALEIISEAREKIAKMDDSSRASLKQAGRDLLLTLRKEIGAMLDRLIVSHIHKTLGPDELAGIIKTVIKDNAGREKGDIVVSLKKDDLEKMEKTLLGALKQETAKGIVLRPSEDIRGGFMISYDSGRSYYDFTDKALAEYISLYLKPKLGDILKETAV